MRRLAKTNNGRRLVFGRRVATTVLQRAGGDRQGGELRAEAARVRRELRLGAKPEVNGTRPSRDLDALLAAITPEQCPLGRRTSIPERSQEKIAGTRSDPGDWKCLEFQDFERAGDGTRTHDVQLGKEAEKQVLSGVHANSPLGTRCSMREWSGISRPFRRRTGPTTGPGLLRRAAPANRNAESMVESSHCQTRRPVSMSRK